MKINSLYKILSFFLVSYRPKFLAFFSALLFFGFSGFGQTVTFSSTTGSGAENAGTGLPTLLVDGIVNLASSVTLIPGGTAIGGGTDYTLASTVIDIPAGTYSNTPFSLGITITDDAVVEADETIVLDFGTITGDVIVTAPTSTTYTILNDDSFVANIAATDAAASESPLGTGTYTVSLDEVNTSGGDITVNYTVGGTATSGSDFVALSGTVVIVNGAQDNTILLTPINDIEVEASETVVVTLGAGTGYTVDIAPNNAATVNITSEDVAPLPVASIAATDAAASESPLDTGTYTVSLDAVNSSGGDITINYTVGGTATSGSDFSALSGTVVIANGAQDNTIVLTPVNDTDVEVSETVVVTLGTGTGYTVAIAPNNAATVNIASEDVAPLPVASIAATDAEASESPLDTGTYTVSLDAVNTSGADITINYTVGGTATSGSDFSALSGTVVIANGAQDNTIVLTPVNDTDVEVSETVVVTLDTGTGYTVAIAPNNAATVNITSEDVAPLPVASIAATDAAASESPLDTGTYTVSLDAVNSSGGDITINYTVGGTATSGSDFVALSGTVVIVNGAQDNTILLTPINDIEVEASETVVVTLGTGTGYTVAIAPNNAATVNIASEDVAPLPVASIAATDAAASESPLGTGTYTVSLDAVNSSGGDITINYTVGGTATSGSDFNALSGTVVIANGDQSNTILLTPINDSETEAATETVVVTLDTGTGYTVGSPDNATVNITSEDTAGVSINDISVNEGDGTATFTVTLNGAVFLGTIVSYATANNSALAGSDYVADSGTIGFVGLNGETRTITIDINEDILVEGDEIFFVNLTNATGFAQLGKTQGIGTIVDNDSYIASITATDAVAAESPLDAGSFTVGLNTTNITGSPIVINYNVSGTATSGSDYIALAGTVSIGNNQESASITVTPINDTAVEAGLETVIVDLASGTGYNVGLPSSATVNISSEDTAGVSIDDVLINEDDGTATFTVTLNANVPSGTTVTFSTADNTATAGSDYETNSGTLFFLGLINETQEITINISDDGVPEGTESFFVNLTNATGLVQIDKGQGEGTIADNDNCMDAPLINSSTTIFCDAFIQDLDAYTDSTVPSGFELIWSSNSDFSIEGARLNTSVVDFEATFYGFLYNEGTDCISPPLEVTLVRNVPPEILSTTPATICGSGTASITATVTSGGSLFWYSSEAGGAPLGEGSTFETPGISVSTTYYVEASANECITERTPVIVTVAPLVDAGVTADDAACSIAGGGATTVDLDGTRTGGSADGVWEIVGTHPSMVTIGAENIVDFEGALDGDYVFRFTTTSAISPCVDESVDVTIAVSTCTMDSDGDGLIDRDENALGLNPNNRDTDADGINDLVEVGSDINNPIDTDSDGIIDALDSNILDSDNDGIVDQLDPANDNPCIPNISMACQIDLGIEKAVDKESILVGREVTFTITLTNLSQIMVTNVAVNDLISPALGFQYVSSTVTKGAYNEIAGVWQLDEVLADEVNILTITAMVPEVGTYQNIAAIVDSFPEDSNATNNTASATVTVTPRSTEECGFLFNQISPNGDGTNDLLRINCIEDYPNNSLQIFDRYGNEVFTANGYDNTWMGTGKNGDLPKGTYFYILDLGDGTEVRKGWIQIIR